MVNRKSQILILSFIICFLPVSQSVAQQQWTLDACMDYAIEHNLEVKQRQNEQRRREISAQASKDARMPRFSASMSGWLGTLHHSADGLRMDADTRLLSMGLQGAVPLYTGNRLSSQIKADKYSLMAASEDVRSAEKDIRVQVAAAYLQALYNRGESSIARQQLDVSRMLLQKSQSLFDKGKRPESDVAEATAMVSRDEARLAAAEGNTELAILDLRLLLNLPDSVAFDICDSVPPYPRPPVPPSPLTDALHPAVQSAAYSILRAEQGVKVARSAYRPTLALAGGVGTFWTDIDTEASRSGQLAIPATPGSLWNVSYHLKGASEWRRKNFLYGVVGLRLTIPIFDAFETKARIRTAKVNLEDAKLAYDNARQRIRKEIRQAWQEAVTAHKRYDAEVKAEEACALAYRYAQKRYDAGMATLFDLSQARQQWVSASESALRMKYEYLIRKKILDIQSTN